MINSSFFVSISFIIFAYIFYKKVWPHFIKNIDNYINKIAENISIQNKLLSQKEETKIINQNKINNLAEEISNLREIFNKRIETAANLLESELESKYLNKKANSKQIIERLISHHKQIIQKKIIDSVFETTTTLVSENKEFQNSYLTNNCLKKIKE